jgi:hypothetical protein
MLELKTEVQEAGVDVIIFVSKQRGRKLRFPIDTPQSEYARYQKLGFRIFRCVECKLESCKDASCSIEEVEIDVEEKSAYKEQTPTDTNSIQNQPIVEPTVTDSPEDDINYEDLSLKDLRDLFPKIKDTSKAGFIDKIHSEDN